MELRPSEFLPSQLGFRASAGHPDTQTDKQDEEGHLFILATPNEVREEGRKEASLEEKQTQILLLSRTAFGLACWFEGFGAGARLLLLCCSSKFGGHLVACGQPSGVRSGGGGPGNGL